MTNTPTTLRTDQIGTFLNEYKDSNLPWRKTELAALLLNLQNAFNFPDVNAVLQSVEDSTSEYHNQPVNPQQKLALRSAGALTYAHFEGWVKEFTAEYYRLLNRAHIPAGNLCDSLLGAVMKSHVNSLRDSNAPHSAVDFAHLLTSQLFSDPSHFDTKYLTNTESNLNWRVFERIVLWTGMPIEDFEKSKSSIGIMLGWRNAIAHGEKRVFAMDKELTAGNYIKNREDILKLIQNFTDKLILHCDSESFLQDRKLSTPEGEVSIPRLTRGGNCPTVS